jgi:Coenzyme PQQ synthesis protein D (PqqD)
MNSGYRVNSPRVMHETIDDEVIVVDLSTGSYYSLRATGAAVWQALDGGLSEREISDAMIVRYDGAAEEITAAVAELLRELTEEGLIVSSDGLDEAGPTAVSQAAQDGKPRERFQLPVVEKHTDMQDLILLDPVHEVGAQGWPQAQADAP